MPGSIAGTHFLVGPLTLNIGTLPAGKAITITFQATVAAPFPVATTCQVTREGTVSGSNFSSVSTDDPDVAGSSDPTVTLIQVAPTISCPANINVNAAPGQSSANVPFAATTTGCPIPTITYKIGATMITSPHLFPAGTTTVDATASNGNAPDATCSFTVAVNQLPVAGTDTIERNAKEDVKVKVATLLLNDTDADNDPLSITGVTSPTPGGATVVLNGNWVYYTRNGTAADSFTYTLSDGRGGIVVGTVNVNIKDTDAQSRDLLDITVDGGGAHIRSDGIPGRSYTIQFSNNANGPWQDLGTTAADTEGIYTFDDPAGTPQRFYRSVFRDP